MRIKYFLIWIFITLTFFGCELSFEDNRRALIVGKLNAPQGTNFELIPIQVIASNSFDANIIAQGFADSSGNYNLISVVPNNASDVAVFVNSATTGGFSNQGFNSAKVSGLSNINFVDNRVSVPDITIGPIIPFKFCISRAADSTSIVEARFTFLDNPTRINLNGTDFNINNNFFSVVNFIATDNGREEARQDFNVIANDTIFFDYRILENGQIVRQENLAIPIDGNTRFLFEL